MCLCVFEWGVGEILVCGIGVCVVVILGMCCGLFDLFVEIELVGGKLYIEWCEGDVVWMMGLILNVYEGCIDLSYY